MKESLVDLWLMYFYMCVIWRSDALKIFDKLSGRWRKMNLYRIFAVWVYKRKTSIARWL